MASPSAPFPEYCPLWYHVATVRTANISGALWIQTSVLGEKDSFILSPSLGRGLAGGPSLWDVSSMYMECSAQKAMLKAAFAVLFFSTGTRPGYRHPCTFLCTAKSFFQPIFMVSLTYARPLYKLVFLQGQTLSWGNSLIRTAWL